MKIFFIVIDLTAKVVRDNSKGMIFSLKSLKQDLKVEDVETDQQSAELSLINCRLQVIFYSI